jgi:hypothetical protein
MASSGMTRRVSLVRTNCRLLLTAVALKMEGHVPPQRQFSQGSLGDPFQ